MESKFKTKKISIKKINRDTRLRKHLKTPLKEDNRQADNESASYYAHNQIKSNTKKAFYDAKNYTEKKIRSIHQRRKDGKPTKNNQNSISEFRNIRPKMNPHIGSSKDEVISNFYQNQSRSMLINKFQKLQFSNSKNNRFSVMVRFFSKFINDLKKIISLKWTAYIAFMGGGVIIILGFLVVLFGLIFGGSDGTTYSGTFKMPFDNSESILKTDDYGWRIHPITGEQSFHYGIDFCTSWHCEIKTIAIGEVIYADNYGTYGNTVIIKHEIYGDILYSMYAHLSDIKVKVGQMVIQGEVIGLEGGDPDLDPNAGSSTGHHLHFGMMDKDMKFVNPTNYLIIN